MVNETRVKELIFPAFTVNGSVVAVTYASRPINGDILRVRVQGVASPGSLWLLESGTNIEIWRKNDFASGTTNIEAYPMIYRVGPTNVTGSPQAYATPVTNNILAIAGSGFTSGTGKTFGPITVFYR